MTTKANDASSAARTFSGPTLLQIALPLGGIGAGCICLNGYGGLQDFSIHHQPATTALPDGHGTTEAAFALLHIRGENPVTRLIEGPFPPEKIYNQGLQGQGGRKGGHEGLPRFKECTFIGEYPFGTVQLSDPNLPLTVSVMGWNPFIPLDDVNSGIPCAILEYTVRNTSGAAVAFDFSYHLSHLATPVGAGGDAKTRNALLPDGTGVLFSNVEEADKPGYGSAALAVAGGRLPDRIKAMWFRGGWFDSISALWREVEEGDLRANDGSRSQSAPSGRNGGSLLISDELQPGESRTYPVVLAWHFPNSPVTVGGVPAPEPVDRRWSPFYATRWADAAAVARYVNENYGSLRERTVAFKDALFSSTLPPAALDAVAANLSILKSPTVLRQANGNLWGWEGCFPGSGCCHGTCTHVWNYAQAFPHLFPGLERTLREQEYLRSMDGRGHINFRAALPDAPTTHNYHAASDGQLGGILKLHRDWQISGDTEWLGRLYPLAKRSLDFCIAAWDPEKRGALFEPHHNTYDIEFWGPDGMCGSIYLGALCAMAEIARALGKTADAGAYAEIARRGAAFLDSELFNGEYYEHRVQWEGLRDTSFADQMAKVNIDDPDIDEMTLLLKREGPKYQYGTGCISDGVIGAWMADLYGVETPLSRDGVRSHLRAIFRHNFKADLSEHACPQRPGYAMGNEAGLLLCSWPRGGKPTLPFVYSDEVWTGIEYQVASHLINEGFVDEGMAIVEAARNRYDGHVRNPWNEYECGNYYARAMASYALLQAFSGFRYSAVTRTLTLAPKVERGPAFRTFFSAATGFGTVEIDAELVTVTIVEGELALNDLHLNRDGETLTLPWNATARAGEPARLSLRPA